MRPVDSHCHLHDAKFDADRPEVLSRALESLEWLVTIGDDLATSREAVALTGERVYATVGVHPYHAGTVTDEALDELRMLARNPRVRAIGEIGLDYYKYNETPRDVQREGFIRQIDLAAELGLPIVVHNRDSDDDVCAILDEHHARVPGIVMHCFPGGVDLLARCLAWPNAMVSFAGNLTFPKATAIHEAAKAAPLERVLVETDAPYLSPMPHRGKRCEPADTLRTAAYLAALRGMSAETVAEVTTENAARVYRVRGMEG